MLETKRLQWHIAWKKSKLSSFVNFQIIVILVGLVIVTTKMGSNKKYARDYIPFGKVMKKNFMLQEQICELNDALTLSYQQNQKYESLLAQALEANRTLEKQVLEYKEADAITKNKVNTVETLVKSMVEERSGYQKLRQDNITLSMDLKVSQEVVKLLEEKLNTLCLNSVHNDDIISEETESKGATMIIEPEVPTGNEIDAESCRNNCEDRLSKESITWFGKARDCSCEEKIEVSDSDSDSSSTDYDTDSDFEIDGSEDFIVEDGITYMFVARCSMTRQYILIDENEDENWFPKTKVYEELEVFLNCKHHIIGKVNCTKQRLDLKVILEGIKRGMKDQVINNEFLNLAFMMFYKTIDCQE